LAEFVAKPVCGIYGVGGDHFVLVGHRGNTVYIIYIYTYIYIYIFIWLHTYIYRERERGREREEERERERERERENTAMKRKTHQAATLAYSKSRFV